jgi:phenylalanyl-tRNA synthetase beta chain
VNGELMEKVRQDTTKAFSLSNALSPDLQYYRLSLTPSLLEKVHPNIKAGYDSFALFELGKVHCQDEWDEQEPTVPKEVNQLGIVLAYNDKAAPTGSAYFQARRYLDAVAPGLASQLVPQTELDEGKDAWGRQLAAPYEPGRSAVIMQDGVICGVVGEFRASVRRALKLPAYSAGLELNLDVVSTSASAYTALSRFPTVWQDLTLKVSTDTAFAKLERCVDKALGANAPDETHIELACIGVYQSAEDPTHKNISFRIRITGLNRTLTDQEVSKTVDAMATAAQQELGAERI